MKKLFFVLLLGLVFNFSFANTLFENDVGNKEKMEYTQISDVFTATLQIAETTSIRSLLFEQNFTEKEFIIYQNKDLPDLEAEYYLILRQSENRTIDKITQIIFYKSITGSAGGLPS